MFNPNYIIQELTRNREVFDRLLSGKKKDIYTWRPSIEKWSLLEIVCHLHDEEIEDFRARVQHTLERPETSPPPIDPVGWVKQRNYSGQDYETMVSKFLQERDKSVAWLQSLNSPNWQNAYQHKVLGQLSAGMFLANWLAHDYLHIRQINSYYFGILKQQSGQDLSYAGDW